MTKHADSGSVFTDDSGVRRRVLTWSVRSTIAAIVLASAGLVLTLGTQVTLPGLDAPLSVPELDGSSGRASEAPAQSGGSVDAPAAGQTPEAPATPAVLSAPTAAPTSAVQPGGTTPARPGVPTTPANPAGPTTTPAGPTASPTTPGSKANRGTASDEAPRADPTHVPGDPDKTPPGKTK